MITPISKFCVLTLLGSVCFSSTPSSERFLTSTPCHAELRKLHDIPAKADCSLIKWDLTLSGAGDGSFHLKSEWGYYIDNRTLEKRGNTVNHGKWITRQTPAMDVINLTTENGVQVAFRKLDPNLLHILDLKNHLMVGDDGNSFTLARVGATSSSGKNSVSTPGEFPAESFTKVVFEGRTPCQEVAREANIVVDAACFKLKWRLRLFQDSTTHKPAYYELERTYHRRSILTGKWTIFSATINNRRETVYQLDPDKPEASIRLMKGDANVLFFLDQNLNFLPGGNEFSYTLNKAQ